MPYQSNADLPDYIKKKSKNEQDAFREAYNSAHAQGKDEATCMAIANAAANKAGSKKNKEYSKISPDSFNGETWIPALTAGDYGKDLGKEKMHEIFKEAKSNFPKQIEKGFFPAIITGSHNEGVGRRGEIKDIDIDVANNKLLIKGKSTDPQLDDELNRGLWVSMSPLFRKEDDGWRLQHLALLGDREPRDIDPTWIGCSFSEIIDGKENIAFTEYEGSDMDVKEIAQEVGEVVYQKIKDTLTFHKEPENKLGGEDMEEKDKLEFAKVQTENAELKTKIAGLEKAEADRKAQEEKDIAYAKFSKDLEDLLGKKIPAGLKDKYLAFGKDLTADKQVEFIASFADLPDLVDPEKNKPVDEKAKPAGKSEYDFSTDEGREKFHSDASAFAEENKITYEDASIKIMKEVK